MKLVKLQAKIVDVDSDVLSPGLIFTATPVEGGDKLVVNPSSIPLGLRKLCYANLDDYVLVRSWFSCTVDELSRGPFVYSNTLIGDEYL
mgnify:CR=1 FL=1|jgi:hypothetical protein